MLFAPMKLTPTFHEDFQIDQRVSFRISGEGPTLTGTIVGVSSVHIISFYIILLDEPYVVPEYNAPWRAVVMPGGEIHKL